MRDSLDERNIGESKFYEAAHTVTHYIDTDDSDVYALLLHKMCRLPMDTALLSRVQSVFRGYAGYVYDNKDVSVKLDVFLVRLIRRAFSAYRAQCKEQRMAFMHVLIRIFPVVKDIRRLLVQYQTDTEDVETRLEETICFCYRQFIHSEAKGEVGPLEWFHSYSFITISSAIRETTGTNVNI